MPRRGVEAPPRQNSHCVRVSERMNEIRYSCCCCALIAVSMTGAVQTTHDTHTRLVQPYSAQRERYGAVNVAFPGSRVRGFAEGLARASDIRTKNRDRAVECSRTRRRLGCGRRGSDRPQVEL